MSFKSISIIFALGFLSNLIVTTKENGGYFLSLLSNNLDDESALKELKHFAQEIFQIESTHDNLYDFLYHFLTVDLEKVSPFGGLTEEEQLSKLKSEVQEEIKNYFLEKIEKKEFNFLEDSFMGAFNRVRDIYERYFLAIIGKKIRLGDTNLQLPFTFPNLLMEEIKNLNKNQDFVAHNNNLPNKKIKEYFNFLKENSGIFNEQYTIYLNTYIKYAALVTNQYSEFFEQIDDLNESASYKLNNDNREAFLRRIEGLTSVFLKLNDSNDAVISDFRDKKSQLSLDAPDNRSSDEIKRDAKDHLFLRLQTMRIEAIEDEDEKRYDNLSYIIAVTVKAFQKEDKNANIFYLMRQLFIQYVTISSESTAQVAIIQQMFTENTNDWKKVAEEAFQLEEGEVHPQVLFAADVLTLPLFSVAERTRGEIPEPFALLYRHLLAIPAKILRGNGVLQLLGHYAIAKPGQEKQYYEDFYKLLQKFRIQNSFNLELLENHNQSAIALNFFINDQYDFEKDLDNDSVLVQNYFKFKTTIVLHMLAFLKKDEIEEKDMETIRKMYQITYKQASDKELEEIDGFNFIVHKPKNQKTLLFDILTHFAKHWESGEKFTDDIEGLNKFSKNTFNVLDFTDGNTDYAINVEVTQTSGSTRNFPVNIQNEFKIGLYGTDALYYKQKEENKNKTAGEKKLAQKIIDFKLRPNSTNQKIFEDIKRNRKVNKSNDEDALKNLDEDDRVESKKVNIDVSSEDEEESFVEDHRDFSDMENDKKNGLVEEPYSKSDLQNAKTFDKNSAPDLNRIDTNRQSLRLNKVKFISGQPLNQKEEEFLADPFLLEKLEKMKNDKGIVSLENEDGSPTEIVYLQIIPHGSDCYKSYKSALNVK